MTAEAIFLAAAFAGFLLCVYGRLLRIDVAAILLMLSLLLPWRPEHEGGGGGGGGEGGLRGILTVSQAFSGFGSAAVVMIVSMFVVSAAMERTGAASIVGERLLRRASGSELTLLLAVVLVVSLFSAVVSDTTSVLVWMPLLLAVCREKGHSPSRLLMPLAFAALLGGQWTLIGTRTNIVVSDYLRTQTGSGLGFLSFTPIALVNWACVVGFLALVGRRLLPRSSRGVSLADRYEVTEYLTEVMATPGADMVGRTLGELDLDGSGEVRVLGLIRGEERLPPTAWVILQPGDVLIVQGRISRISELLAQPGIEIKEEMRLGDQTLRSADLRMVEATIVPNSRLEGRTIQEMDFHARYGLSVLAIGRRGRSLTERPLKERLEVGDSLLLIGHEEMIRALRGDLDVVLIESRALPVVGRKKAVWLLSILVAMVVLAATRLVDPALAIVLGAVAAVLTGCIAMRSAYEAVDWRVVFVLGGMLPFGLALEETGVAGALAGLFADGPFALGQTAAFALFLAIVVCATQVVENTAVAVLFAPVAFELAQRSGSNPVPFLLGTALCASAGFASPMAHECTLLVMGPGNYRLSHFLILGLPAAAITWAVVVVVVPMLHPLAG